MPEQFSPNLKPTETSFPAIKPAIVEYATANEARKQEIKAYLLSEASNSQTKFHLELEYKDRVGVPFRLGFELASLIDGILNPAQEKERIRILDSEDDPTDRGVWNR